MTGPPNHGVSELRGRIDERVAADDAATAATLLSDLWARDRSSGTAGFLVSRYEKIGPRLGLLPYRLALLRSFTVEPLVPVLRAAAFAAGVDLAVYLSPFNSHAQDILDPASGLHGFQPDAVILAVQTRDIAPELWDNFTELGPDAVSSVIDRVRGEFAQWVGAFRARSRAHLVIHNLAQPELAAAGILDGQTDAGQGEAIRRINRELVRLAGEHPGVYVLDYDALIARHGRRHWSDERKWLTVRFPLAAAHLEHLALEWLRFVHVMSGKTAKVLVVDLDNTLWGGVIGEDGLDGIQLGSEYPGAAYQALQRALVDLHRRGVLLAVCSKNNPDDAMEALQRHPGMVLSPAHFAARRINWSEKSENLRSIAAELNVGVDALAFLDDNPVERQQVRQQLPAVMVIPLPDDPMAFARCVRESPVFERLVLSDEDRQRGAMYQAQQARAQLEQGVATPEDFYRSLGQEAEIAGLTPATLTRVAQLTAKTNQFNLTTRRYTEQQLLDLQANGAECFSLRVRDRFGDNGLVGVGILRYRSATCEIDTLLLSCRVIGRTVETAFLSFLADRARSRGAARLQGWFLPTRKNAPAAGFYEQHHFTALRREEPGTLWELDLSRPPLACPPWIALRVATGESR